jgi:hypothetical protein
MKGLLRKELVTVKISTRNVNAMSEVRFNVRTCCYNRDWPLVEGEVFLSKYWLRSVALPVRLIVLMNVAIDLLD